MSVQPFCSSKFCQYLNIGRDTVKDLSLWMDGSTGLRSDRHIIVIWLSTVFHDGGIYFLWLYSNPHQSIYWPLLDYRGEVGLYNKEHACSDTGEDIIHAYMRLIQTKLQQSGDDSYSEGTKDRPFVLAKNKRRKPCCLPC